MTKTKANLLADLKKIEAAEQQAMIEKWFPIFKKKYLGKTLRYRNCYSCPEKKSDYWWLYIKVIDIQPEDIYDTRGNGVTAYCRALTFQTDKHGNISIEPNTDKHIHNLGQPISKEAYNKAWRQLVTGKIFKL